MIRLLLGAALLLFSFLPLHRLLDPERTGPAGRATRASAEAAWSTGLLGSAIAVGLGFVFWRLLGGERLRGAVSRASSGLAALPPVGFAVAAGSLTTALSAGIALFVFGAIPTSVDEMTQLAHAAALASGRLTLPLEGGAAAWAVQNGWITPDGWAAIYPPIHTILLAVGLRVGVPWLVGPVLIGMGTALFSAGLDRLVDDRRLARVAALLLAVSPFWLLIGATQLSHASAAAFALAVFYGASRAREAHLGWTVFTGMAIGAFVAGRPLTGLAVSSALLAGLWLPAAIAGDGPGRLAKWGGGLLVGGAPFALLLFGWNASLFGSPTRLGYSAAFGPAHGLGFHTDPWGNVYGALEAVAYTGADIVQLGAHLFESPLPVTALIAVCVLARSLAPPARVFALWVGAAVIANALYWHHGVHMGPRMLYETVPAWIALAVFGVAAVTSERSGLAAAARDLTAWVAAVALLGAAILGPSFVLAQRVPVDALDRAALPSDASIDSDGRAVVFVHGGWPSRISARLAASGMRRDSIETALRRNDLCAVDAYARARVVGEGVPNPLDMEPRSGSPAQLVEREITPGLSIRVDPSRRPSATCLREARADRLGVVELEPLLWQAPPLPGRAIVVARDMGPVHNAGVLDHLGGTAFLYGELEGELRLLDYDEGMELLWGGPVLRPPGPDEE